MRGRGRKGRRGEGRGKRGEGGEEGRGEGGGRGGEEGGRGGGVEEEATSHHTAHGPKETLTHRTGLERNSSFSLRDRTYPSNLTATILASMPEITLTDTIVIAVTFRSPDINTHPGGHSTHSMCWPLPPPGLWEVGLIRMLLFGGIPEARLCVCLLALSFLTRRSHHLSLRVHISTPFLYIHVCINSS